ncbi:hypothetical protein [Corallococcus silvisoli]|uniref:hypothetical protein n=1 Tax=Corallococcus silvisoli TaxID=2697031 RepID=UPI001376B925|nr:hypothetical protein [Corallococcus silvisoli]NBD09644.1 hypothetical protein [Corallococcus silvisoli]
MKLVRGVFAQRPWRAAAELAASAVRAELRKLDKLDKLAKGGVLVDPEQRAALVAIVQGLEREGSQALLALPPGTADSSRGGDVPWLDAADVLQVDEPGVTG